MWMQIIFTDIYRSLSLLGCVVLECPFSQRVRECEKTGTWGSFSFQRVSRWVDKFLSMMIAILWCHWQSLARWRFCSKMTEWNAWESIINLTLYGWHLFDVFWWKKSETGDGLEIKWLNEDLAHQIDAARNWSDRSRSIRYENHRLSPEFQRYYIEIRQGKSKYRFRRFWRNLIAVICCDFGITKVFLYISSEMRLLL